MISVLNDYTVGELLDEFERDHDLASGEYTYYIENGVIKI